MPQCSKDKLSSPAALLNARAVNTGTVRYLSNTQPTSTIRNFPRSLITARSFTCAQAFRIVQRTVLLLPAAAAAAPNRALAS